MKSGSLRISISPGRRSKTLDQRPAAAAKNEEVAGMRIAPQRLLDDQRQTVESFAHIGVAGH
jgi:hypothetical protein